MHDSNGRLRLIFQSTGWAIDFAGGGQILAGLPAIYSGWNIRSGPPRRLAQFKPRALISHTSEGWHWRRLRATAPRRWPQTPPRSPLRVICEIHDVCIDWFLAEHRDYLCLHGAAAQIGNGLVCFPAKFRAGKSTLAAALAACGHKLFCDDVLGLEPECESGVSLGLMPRLRAPLPPALNSVLRDFVGAHRGPADDKWIYLRLGEDRIATLGETAPIKAIVLLQRKKEGGRPELRPAGAAEVLKGLIAENITRKIPMPIVFERLHRLAATRERLHLSYSDPVEAAEFLSKAFA